MVPQQDVPHNKTSHNTTSPNKTFHTTKCHNTQHPTLITTYNQTSHITKLVCSQFRVGWLLVLGHYGSISGILFHLNVILNLRAVSGILINESNNCGGVPLFFNWVQNQLDIRQCYYQLISWSFFIKGSRCLQRGLPKNSIWWRLWNSSQRSYQWKGFPKPLQESQWSIQMLTTCYY